MRRSIPAIHRPRRAVHRVAAAGLVLVALASPALFGEPPAAGDRVIRRSTIDAGGGESSSPDFTVRGTLGQAEPAASASPAFMLRGGFWVRPGGSDRLHRSSFE